MKRFVASLVLAAGALSAWALPTVDQVQGQIASGNFTQAESMMREVVVGKPGSAKAHYVYAEILAHNKRFDLAASEAAQAKKLDPALQFTQPEKFRAFEHLLDQEKAAARLVVPAERSATPALRQPAPVERASGVPGWLWGVGGAGLAFAAWRLLAARRPNAADGALAPATAGTGPTFGGTPPGYAPGYGQAPPAPRGNGMLGAGLAAAGGFAAGMFAEKLLDGRHESGAASAGASRSSDGLTPGLFDDARSDNVAARDLEQRPIDFGSGGDWGADAGSASADSGSDGDDSW